MSDDDDTNIGDAYLKEEKAENSAPESSCELSESIIGIDKTSADYYFDSYSHFGTSTLLFINYYMGMPLICLLRICGCSGNWCFLLFVLIAS